MNRFYLPNILSDVSLVTGTVDSKISSATAKGVLWQSAPGRFLLDVPEVARYLVTSGSTVTIDPAPQVDDLAVERFLMMTPLAALLYQRGVYAFHASVITNGLGSVMLAGDSGVGKSTLLVEMLQRGWNMLADDLAIVSFKGQTEVVTYSTGPDVELWPEAIIKLGIDSNYLTASSAGRRTYSWREQFILTSVPLRTIYWLGVHNKCDCCLESIEGSSRFNSLGQLQYNSHIAHALCNKYEYMRCAASIAQSVPLFRLRRPQSSWSAGELADLVEKHQTTL